MVICAHSSKGFPSFSAETAIIEDVKKISDSSEIFAELDVNLQLENNKSAISHSHISLDRCYIILLNGAAWRVNA